MKILRLLLLFCFFSGTAQDLNNALKPLKFRSIGPFRGGRANAGTGVVGDPLTYYMGVTGGGVWKTTNSGHQWENVSDGHFKTSSVGAIAVSESHPNTVYVGMGEHAPRGVMTSHGDGVYKSTDAGKSWQHLGLTETQHISRIVIHPNNPDIVWVAAQGPLHGKSENRGVYKSIDGGKTWKKTLYTNALSGASELSIDIHNPQVLYAAMWEHIRKPWKVISGGTGSGLFKSVDGGESWKPIHNGLPEEKGKMAIAVSRANPNTVFALIESDSNAEKGGLFVSSNAGNSWKRVSSDHRLIQRAWYYIEIALDPQDENTLYVLSAATYKSIDGGKKWERIGSAHGDYHDLWINPQNSKNMILTSDGGSEVSFDAGKNWSRIDHLPTAQFYRVTTDNLFPYNIYGGQQDNSSVKISSIALGDNEITERNWSASAGGESAFLAFDPNKPDKVMGGSYLGTIELLDTKNTGSTNIMISPNLYLGLAARDMKYLFNWNAPIVRSQHEENTFYHGAQYLLRTRDEGISWEEISPDLTRNDDSKQGKGGGPLTNEAVGAENYGTLSYVIESPHEAGVLYTGSDDGLVYITKDGGKSWTNITPKGLEETMINSIEVSPHDPATVYFAATRYKFNDFTPALYKSEDYGKTWKSIKNGIPQGAYTKVIREDSKRKDLLFAGTYSGLYVSWDGGKKWHAFQNNLPITPITDLSIAHDDLVIATQGRSFWILDDLELLRQYDTKKEKLKLFLPPKTIWANWYSALNSNNSNGTSSMSGVNPATGMVIYYELEKADPSTPITLTIKDASGAVVNSFTSKADGNYIAYEGAPSKKPTLTLNPGLNRFVWNLRHEDLPGIPKVYIEGSFRGHKAIPGTYTLLLTYGDEVSEIQTTIEANPMFSLTDVDYEQYHTFMNHLEQQYKTMTRATNQLYTAQQELQALIKQGRLDQNSTLKQNAQQLLEQLKVWDAKMAQRLSKAYDDVENFENGFTAHYLTLINQTDSSIPKVTKGAKQKAIELDAQWEALNSKATALKSAIQTFNSACFNAGVGILTLQ